MRLLGHQAPVYSDDSRLNKYSKLLNHHASLSSAASPQGSATLRGRQSNRIHLNKLIK